VISRSIIIGALIAAVSLAIGMMSEPVTFDVAARSEVVEVKVASEIEWDLEDVSLDKKPFSGSFQPFNGSNVVIRRIGQHPLIILVTAAEGADAGVVTPRGGEPQRLGHDKATFEVATDRRSPEAAPIVLPLVGTMTIGSAVPTRMNEGASRTGVLVNGQIRLLGRGLLSGTVYEGGTYQLSLGDQLTFPSGRESAGFGVVTPARDAGLDVKVQYIGEVAHIGRIGSEGVSIRATRAASVVGDRVIQLAWGVLIVLGTARGWLLQWRPSTQSSRYAAEERR
jgi:hypothetical protein